MFPRLPSAAAALALAAAAWCLAPSAALALYPCNGPGPGEILVGMDNNTTPPTPLCEYVGDQGSVDPGPGGYWVERFAAIAWGYEASGRPSYGYAVNAGSAGDADAIAMQACARAGLSECHSGTNVANGAIVIVEGHDGSLHAEWGGNARQAQRKAMRNCRAQTGRRCSVEQVLESPAQWVSY